MITIILLLGVFSLLTGGVMVFQLSHAPVGHEDADGFHFSNENAQRIKSRPIYDEQGAGVRVVTQHLPALGSRPHSLS